MNINTLMYGHEKKASDGIEGFLSQLSPKGKAQAVGTGYGAPIGALLGAGTGALLAPKEVDENGNKKRNLLNTLLAGGVGGLGGAVAGGIGGHALGGLAYDKTAGIGDYVMAGLKGAAGMPNNTEMTNAMAPKPAASPAPVAKPPVRPAGKAVGINTTPKGTTGGAVQS